MKRIDDPYRELAAAVLRLAMKDRREAGMVLEMNPGSVSARELYEDADSFIRSRWCSHLLELLDIDRDKYMEAADGR